MFSMPDCEKVFSGEHKAVEYFISISKIWHVIILALNVQIFRCQILGMPIHDAVILTI